MTLCDSCQYAGDGCEIWPQHELLRCAEFRHRPLTVEQSTGKRHHPDCDTERQVFGDCTCED